MKVKILLIIISLSMFFRLKASVPPFQDGSYWSTVITNKQVDILYENILISINQDFTEAKYVIEYKIKCSSCSTHLPLLFHNNDSYKNLKVWADGKKIPLKNVSPYLDTAQILKIFNIPFDERNTLSTDFYNLQWGPWYNEEQHFTEHPLDNLQYLELEIIKKTHHITVEYKADVWRDQSGDISKYSFRYSLFPARFWNSYGGLDVTIEIDGNTDYVSTNLGLPKEGEFKNINHWTFDRLPADAIVISFSPTIPLLGKILLFITPLNLTLIASIILILIIIKLFKRKRLKNPSIKMTTLILIAALLVPIFMWTLFICSSFLVSMAVGQHAVKNGGYMVFAIMAFPWYYFISVPLLYFLFYWTDKSIKKNLTS